MCIRNYIFKLINTYFDNNINIDVNVSHISVATVLEFSNLPFMRSKSNISRLIFITPIRFIVKQRDLLVARDNN